MGRGFGSFGSGLGRRARLVGGAMLAALVLLALILVGCSQNDDDNSSRDNVGSGGSSGGVSKGLICADSELFTGSLHTGDAECYYYCYSHYGISFSSNNEFQLFDIYNNSGSGYCSYWKAVSSRGKWSKNGNTLTLTYSSPSGLVESMDYEPSNNTLTGVAVDGRSIVYEKSIERMEDPCANEGGGGGGTGGGGTTGGGGSGGGSGGGGGSSTTTGRLTISSYPYSATNTYSVRAYKTNPASVSQALSFSADGDGEMVSKGTVDWGLSKIPKDGTYAIVIGVRLGTGSSMDYYKATGVKLTNGSGSVAWSKFNAFK